MSDAAGLTAGILAATSAGTVGLRTFALAPFRGIRGELRASHAPSAFRASNSGRGLPVVQLLLSWISYSNVSTKPSNTNAAEEARSARRAQRGNRTSRSEGTDQNQRLISQPIPQPMPTPSIRKIRLPPPLRRVVRPPAHNSQRKATMPPITNPISGGLSFKVVSLAAVGRVIHRRTLIEKTAHAVPLSSSLETFK
jgi:hypothetical protein